MTVIHCHGKIYRTPFSAGKYTGRLILQLLILITVHALMNKFFLLISWFPVPFFFYYTTIYL